MLLYSSDRKVGGIVKAEVLSRCQIQGGGTKNELYSLLGAAREGVGKPRAPSRGEGQFLSTKEPNEHLGERK